MSYVSFCITKNHAADDKFVRIHRSSMVVFAEHYLSVVSVVFVQILGGVGEGGCIGLPPNQLFMIFKITYLMPAYRLCNYGLLDLNLLSSSDETFYLNMIIVPTFLLGFNLRMRCSRYKLISFPSKPNYYLGV